MLCVHRYRRRELQFMGYVQRCSFLLYPALTLHYLIQVWQMYWYSPEEE